MPRYKFTPDQEELFRRAEEVIKRSGELIAQLNKLVEESPERKGGGEHNAKVSTQE
jgi:hypothetical protein